MLDWNPDMVRFMRDASEHTDYYRELTELLLPELSPDMHICDAGCGLGYLAMYLAPYVRKVTAIDLNPAPIAFLREEICRRGITNIEVLCGDLSVTPPAEPYDAMVFCLYGSLEEILAITSAQCRGQVFAFKRNYKHHRFSAGTHPLESNYLGEAEAQLLTRGISCEHRDVAPEFGQPFRSLSDARRFFEIYSRDGDSALLTEAFLLSRLRLSDDPEFPYYLPQTRDMGLLRWHTQK